MGLQDGQEVLDLACGPGVISRLIAEAHPASRVTAMDLNGELLNAARQEVAAAGLEQITFVQGDVYAPPLEPGRFDFIYARLLFQHLEDPLRALQMHTQSTSRLLKAPNATCKREGAAEEVMMGQQQQSRGGQQRRGGGRR